MTNLLPRMLVVAGMATVLLPWIQDDGGSRWGLGEGDGATMLVLGFVTLVLIHFGYRFAWIGAALATVVAARGILTLGGSEGVDAGIGIWAAVLLFAAAAIALIYELLSSIERPDD